MQVDPVEFEWQRRLALRALACALSELKSLAAETRLERAMRRHALALKYGYNPAQPRVPKGNEDGGQWTATDANGNPLSERPSREDRIRLAGPWPSNDPPEPLDDIPKKRPATSAGRTAVLKRIARRIQQTGETIEFFARFARWIQTYSADIASYNDPPKPLKDLQEAVSAPAHGYDIHHIVEKAAAEQYGFAREVIDHPTNLARVPRLKHHEINAWYQRPNADYGWETPRAYLRGRSWGVREAVGLEALRIHGVLMR